MNSLPAQEPYENMSDPTRDLPFAHGGPGVSGVIRSAPEDFRVDEIGLVEPDGAGEHVLLQVEKRGCNTDWLAGMLARHAGVPRRDVSYAGQKDRHAVTTQWFSVRLAGRAEPPWEDLDSTEVKVLQHGRHSRKLRTGALRGNRFRLRLRGLEGDREQLVEQLEAVRQEGVPNYFGEQRFGMAGSNLESARRLFAGELTRLKRQQRGIYLSAARSHLFNLVLACRVENGTWNHPLAGERLMLEGSRSSFRAEAIDDEIRRRCLEMDIHPSGPLWGRGEADVGAAVSVFEQQILAPWEAWCEGLARHGLQQERRALRARVADLEWSLDRDVLELAFSLPRGCFATVLLRECADYRQA
jgi:tRNA pseudouridine13 synthase